MVAAVVFMAGWNAYICLRLRPDTPTVLINLSFWLVPVLALLALTGRPVRSFALGTAITFLLQRLHWLKWKYLAATWTAADFRMLLDSANWTIVHQYPFLISFGAVCAIVLVLSWLLVPRGAAVGWKARVSAALFAAALVAGDFRWHTAHVFDPFGFNTYGHFANLVFSASTLRYEPPAIDGDSALFVERASRLPRQQVRAPARSPDIVVWLQESTMDLRLLDVRGAQLPTLFMHQPDGTTREIGPLRVHTWGGSTWLSEFALLTGLSHEDFGASGNGVYYTVTPNLRFSLPKTLKQAGYHTITLTGAPKAFYNADSAYRDLGFDQVLNPLDFSDWGDRSLERDPIGDEQLGRYALDVLARPRDKPLFLFVLSVIQHGPYDADYKIGYGLDRSALDRETAARLSHYVSQMEATSEAAKAFSHQLLSGSRPTALVYFGDHQPNLEGRVDYVSGIPNARYLTSYAIRTNADFGPADPAPPVLDVSYLGAVILGHTGIATDKFFEANRMMRLLCQGRLTDCPDTELRRSYNAYLFHDLEAADRDQ